MLSHVQQQEKRVSISLPLACRQVMVSSEDVASMVRYKQRAASDEVSVSTHSDGLRPASRSGSPEVLGNSGDVVPMEPIVEVTPELTNDPAQQLAEKPGLVRTLTSAVGRKAPNKPPRPTFTPQLFKTFSQAELKLKRDAQKESKRHSMTTRSGSMADPGERGLPAFVKAPAFDVFFTCVVIVNSIFIGVELQVSLSSPDGTPVPIAVIQYIFTFLFLMELILRWAAAGFKRFLCGEDWLWGWLDLIIVLTSLWEVGFEVAFWIQGTSGDGGGLSSLTSLKVLRIVRITRIVKAARLIRIFRFVMAFRLLIASIIATLKSLLWALMLLALIIYVFAILLTQAVHTYISDPDCDLEPAELQASHQYFGSLGQTMLSLFMSIAGGVSWEQVVWPLRAMSEAWIWVFLFYISFTYFAVLNVVTAVFCQSAIDGAQNDHASKVHAILANKEAHLGKINTLFAKFGADDGVITFKMFQDKINSVEVREYFQTLGLDVWDAWSFFKLLDKDAGGAVEIEEFLMGCLRLRGQATAMDVGKIINDQQWLMKTQGKFNAYMEVELKQIKDHLTILTGINCSSDDHIGWIFESHNLGEQELDTASDASCA
ncbi:Cacna1i [Symbiodinium natans]|uniref:Cacna1i protein n=1 Tax=Symbiodinium natans TaxID=878477 RepID=A0A812TEP4_9DINO|nr:Cacna1i [Symbiodinium natans]